MTLRLFLEAITKYLLGVVLVGAVIFLSAGSLSFFFFLAYPCIIIRKIKYEEELLEGELKGYSEYKQRVRYRLIPFIW